MKDFFLAAGACCNDCSSFKTHIFFIFVFIFAEILLVILLHLAYTSDWSTLHFLNYVYSMRSVQFVIAHECLFFLEIIMLQLNSHGSKTLQVISKICLTLSSIHDFVCVVRNKASCSVLNEFGNLSNTSNNKKLVVQFNSENHFWRRVSL